MKILRNTIFMILALSSSASVYAQDAPKPIERQGDLLEINMPFDLKAKKVKSNEACIITPMLVNGADTLKMKSIGLYGRSRYYQTERSGKKISGSDEILFRAKNDAPELFDYDEIVRFQPWMDGASLITEESTYGCCEKLESTTSGIIYTYVEPKPVEKLVPEMIFVAPEVETVKIRHKEGRAYVDFPVNKTVIYPDFRNNQVELAKIVASIDSVRNNSDVKILSIDIKGYASPEGPYANNVRLAKGRTEALKAYVDKLYGFAPGFITTSYEAEDWQGLRDYVESSKLANRDALLAVIDSDLEPDAKDAAIRTKFPTDYRFLLENVYPGLRHSDYTTHYEVASYTDAVSIAAVYAKEPQNLSLNELYILAETFPQGSEQFCDVFETAVRMFPTDQVSNLNAASTALLLGQLNKAESYLAKAGNSAEADYTRGVLAFMREDYDTAMKYLLDAQKAGINQAEALINNINALSQQ